ncbi:MAG: Co2+/Mg2+ efflux protein ApaG [Pseudomonadota bacterium]|nr:Co2+/Mg2+ efflux protein ApaG [Pseudomonadota bacterium]
MDTGTYESVTDGIKVLVRPFYLDDQSKPGENYFVWAYHVEIVNDSHERVQLRTRFWRITDAAGRVQEVRGPGVVGEQPVLHPGEAFEYTSGTPLPTPSGIMAGTYQMELANGEQFDVEIPAFSLDSPYQLVKLN